MKLLTIISTPVSIILVTMSKPIVRIIFQRGAFDINAAILTSKVLASYSFGLVAMAIISLITKAYYSIQDMKTPILISLTALILNTFLNISLAPIMDIGGIALGTNISVILALFMEYLILIGICNCSYDRNGIYKPYYNFKFIK